VLSCPFVLSEMSAMLVGTGKCNRNFMEAGEGRFMIYCVAKGRKPVVMAIKWKVAADKQ